MDDHKFSLRRYLRLVIQLLRLSQQKVQHALQTRNGQTMLQQDLLSVRF